MKNRSDVGAIERGLLIAGVLVSFVAVNAEAKSAGIAKLGATGPGVEHRYGELIVKLRKSTLRTAEVEVYSGLLNKLGSDSVLGIQPFRTDSSYAVVRLNRDEDMTSAIANLKSHSEVEVAEPNYLYHTFEDGIPNDPDFAKQWGLNNTGQADSQNKVGIAGADIHVLPLWQAGVRGDRKVLVAVIDTGIDWTHPDLKDNIFTNNGETDGDSKDNDGNGFIDDVHGWNFVANSNKSTDDHGHGTHCAGTIGAVGNNSNGIAGINRDVSLLPVKFLDSQGSGSLKDAVEAINYARLMKVSVMSNSWGGGSTSEALNKSVEEAKNAGILFVVAAGNDGTNNDTSPTYPANINESNVVAVAATDNRDQLASFSNYGTKTVHVAAPGVNVYSTYKEGKYKSSSGTSMAAPHVAGIAALLLSQHPDWSFTEIKNRLITTSDPMSSLSNRVAARGRVNAYNALHGIISPNRPDESAWITVNQVIESEHPYGNKLDSVFKISQPGAKWMRVHFEKIEVETGYDKIKLETNKGEVADEFSGKYWDVFSGYVDADELKIHLTTDEDTTQYGFKIDRYQYIPR